MGVDENRCRRELAKTGTLLLGREANDRFIAFLKTNTWIGNYYVKRISSVRTRSR